MNIWNLEKSIGEKNITRKMRHQREILSKLGIDNAYFSYACEEFVGVPIEEMETLQKRIDDTLLYIRGLLEREVDTGEVFRFIDDARR